MEKLFFFDLETTGIEPKRNGIHQLAGIIVIDGKIVDDFILYIKPFEDQVINIEALAISNTALGQLESYRHPKDAFKKLTALLSEYCNKYDKNDRFYIAGYNNAGFDNLFLREYFLRNNDSSFNQWFWDEPIDVFVLAGYCLAAVRDTMENFKLPTVAKRFGIKVWEEKLHNAQYDVKLTYQLYQKRKENLKSFRV